MKNRLLCLLTVLAIAACLAGSAENNVYGLGDTVEDFTVTTFDGRALTLSGVLQEKEAVLINIWATWCGPCRSEFPFLQEAWEQYGDRVGVLALSCGVNDTDEVLAAYAAEMGLTFPVARDTAGLSDRFDAAAIPTSIMVDRFGTVCFMEAGAMPDTDSFVRLFEAFLGDGYTESVVLDGLPPIRPNVAPSTVGELSAALNAEGGTLVFENGTDKDDWPMIAAVKGGRSVAVSSNSRVENSTARVLTHVRANAGDVLETVFSISSAAGFDVMQIVVNGETVKSFGGEKDWMSYAYPFPGEGEYDVEIRYVNDPLLSYGVNTLWLDSVALISGDAAEAALAANPVYPVSDGMVIRVLNADARKLAVDDPLGIIGMLFGGTEFYIIPDETAEFEFSLPAGYDPELALVSYSFNRAVYALSELLSDGVYRVSGGGDSVETTGYCGSSVYYYPSLADANADIGMSVTYFRDENNLNVLLSEIERQLGNGIKITWSYADGSAPAAQAETDAAPADSADAETDSESEYTVKYVDQDGNPVAGVMCQVCDDATCQVFVSDAEGICAFTLAPYAWEIHTLMVPAGYTGDTETVTAAPVEGGEMVFVLTRQ